MARDFLTVLKANAARRDPLEDVDETAPGFIPDPSTYDYGAPGRRRARTFSQVIADATRGIDAGMNRFDEPLPDLNSEAYRPDWRGHYDHAQDTPAPRAALQLATGGRSDELRRKFTPKGLVGWQG